MSVKTSLPFVSPLRLLSAIWGYEQNVKATLQQIILLWIAATNIIISTATINVGIENQTTCFLFYPSFSFFHNHKPPPCGSQTIALGSLRLGKFKHTCSLPKEIIHGKIVSICSNIICEKWIINIMKCLDESNPWYHHLRKSICPLKVWGIQYHYLIEKIIVYKVFDEMPNKDLNP